jgi:hypothetical protein
MEIKIREAAASDAPVIAAFNLRLASAAKDVCRLRLYVHRDNAGARRAYGRLGMQLTRYEIFELEVGAGEISVLPG